MLTDLNKPGEITKGMEEIKMIILCINSGQENWNSRWKSYSSLQNKSQKDELKFKVKEWNKKSVKENRVKLLIILK